MNNQLFNLLLFVILQKNKTYKIVYLLLITVCTVSGFAQVQPIAIDIQSAVSGIVREIREVDSVAIAFPNANIRLLNAGDSSLVKGMLSDSIGRFLFPTIKQGDYLLAVSFIGYATSFTQIPSTRFRENDTIDIGIIVLDEAGILLDEVVVEGPIPELVIRGDTMEYNPAAFKVKEGAVVEDLLKLLPGLEVDKNGRITTSSQKVISRVLVNGQDFFENDPKIATQNITVEIVDKIQVIEKPTDTALLTGVDNGEKETVINIKIKKNMFKGWMGNVNAGAGTLLYTQLENGSRYNLQSMLNNFNEKTMKSIVVNAGNTNSGSGGVTNTHSLGLNYNATVNEKLKLGGNVNYNFSDNYSERNSFRTNLLVDSVSYRRSSSNNRNSSRNIGFNSKIDYKPDSLLTIVFSQQVSFRFSDSNNQSFEMTQAGDRDSTLVNRSHSVSESKTNGTTIVGSLIVTRLFSRKGRRLSLTLNGNLNLSSTNGANVSTNEFFLQPDRNMNFNQQSGTSSNTNSFSLRTGYVEPLRENMQLSVFYDFNQNGTLNLKDTYDFNETDSAFSLRNTDYSRSLKNQYFTQTIGVTLNTTKPKYYYNIGINILPSSTQSTNFIKDGVSEGKDSILNQIKAYKVINYVPQINFVYRFSDVSNLNFSYRGNTRQPTVSQLDPTPDNTNPLYIRSGNPDLLPAFSNFMSLNFSKYIREKLSTLSTSIDYSFTLNEIINYTDYELGTGIQHTAPKNENGTWNAGGNMMFNLPLDKNKRLRLNINFRINYSNQIGYTTLDKQSYRNISGSLIISEGLGLNYSKDWFSGFINANANHLNTTNSLESGQQQRNANYRISYTTMITLPKEFTFDTDINYAMQRGLTAGYNRDEVLWNIGISKQFMKNKSGSLKFVWTDILQKRMNISHAITANYIEDFAVNTLSSYVMLTFTYRLNKIGGKI